MTTRIFILVLLLTIVFTTMGPTWSMPTLLMGGAGPWSSWERLLILWSSRNFLASQTALTKLFDYNLLALTIHAVWREFAIVISLSHWSLLWTSNIIRYAARVEPIMTGDLSCPKKYLIPDGALPWTALMLFLSLEFRSFNLPFSNAALVSGITNR